MGRDKPGKPRRPRKTDPDADKAGGVTVVTDFDPITNSYHCTVHIGEDFSFGLNRDQAIAYAAQVLDVANQADHDCAVIRLLVERVGVELEAAVQVVTNDIRPDRPPTNHKATHPLELYAGVGMNPQTRALKGHVVLTRQGEQAEYGRFDVADLRMHALTVLEATASADLDSGLYRALRGLFELEPNRTRAIIEDLANYREPWW